MLIKNMKIFIIIVICIILTGCFNTNNTIQNDNEDFTIGIDFSNYSEISEEIIQKQTNFSLLLFESITNIHHFSQDNFEKIPKFYNWKGLKSEYFESIDNNNVVMGEKELARSTFQNSRMLTFDGSTLTFYEEDDGNNNLYLIIYNFREENMYGFIEFNDDNYVIQYDIQNNQNENYNINMGFIQKKTVV